MVIGYNKLIQMVVTRSPFGKILFVVPSTPITHLIRIMPPTPPPPHHLSFSALVNHPSCLLILSAISFWFSFRRSSHTPNVLLVSIFTIYFQGFRIALPTINISRNIDGHAKTYVEAKDLTMNFFSLFTFKVFVLRYQQSTYFEI